MFNYNYNTEIIEFTENEIQNKVLARNEMCKYLNEGWTLSDDTLYQFILRRNTATFLDHIVIFLFTFFWLPLWGNLIYYLYKREKKIIIK